MARLQEVPVRTAAIRRTECFIGRDRCEETASRLKALAVLLAGRAVWNVNSTAQGGGVVELLEGLLPYERGAGVDARWLVIEGDAPFFEITKRIHNYCHGTRGDEGPLGDEERAHYEWVSHENAQELLAVIEPGDILVLHDPQTAGLIRPAQEAGAKVVWRCHIGSDTSDEYTECAWAFLRPYVEHADALIFSRESYIPHWVNREVVTVISPSIDPFTPKNQEIDTETVRSILAHTGLISVRGDEVLPCFTRQDGSPARVNRYADLVQTGPAPQPDMPLVTQISRWDRLKDMPGVMQGFAEFVVSYDYVHLALVGPNVSHVTDDPEGSTVLMDCWALWRDLPHAVRERITLVCLPMTDKEENAAIVNALQRHAAVVGQKSLKEGFGLTVTEAMWKGRPVVASGVGGIVDQIDHNKHGLLVDDPSNLKDFGTAVRFFLEEKEEAERMGKNAHRRVIENFLPDRALRQETQTIAGLFGVGEE